MNILNGLLQKRMEIRKQAEFCFVSNLTKRQAFHKLNKLYGDVWHKDTLMLEINKFYSTPE